MTTVAAIVTLSPRDFDAVLFDLDGVLTRTASVHAAAWKKLFDAVLERRSTLRGEAFVPFDIDTDYRRYVDGKPRQDGALSFLESRGIELPLGAPDDAPGEQSVEALGRLKDRYFTEQQSRSCSLELLQRATESSFRSVSFARSRMGCGVSR
jgi:beta-phosphoglucomutase-like phosphatase (HAD superfamily)